MITNLIRVNLMMEKKILHIHMHNIHISTLLIMPFGGGGGQHINCEKDKQTIYVYILKCHMQ